MGKQSEICIRCLFDGSIPGISFNNKGLCSYCQLYEELAATYVPEPEVREQRLKGAIEKIKKAGRNRKYDCVIGVSGGVDSSYVAYLTKQHGLRPLAVHLDNGWNSEIAASNIHNILTKLGIDLYTHVIDWEEFKDLQISFLRAGVVDIEMLTDHAIKATILKALKNEGIRYCISGSNYVTEAIMPVSWTYSKWDQKNIKAIHQIYGNVPIRTFPMYGFYEKVMDNLFSKTIRILNFIDYNKKSSMEILINELGWKPYGGKHHESFFTKFYQLYILPKKFGIDKRLAHFSTLINSGQLMRDQAIAEMERPLYESKEEEERDVAYFCKKIGMSRTEFDEIMNAPPKPHTDYPNGQMVNNLFKKAKKVF